MDVVIERHERHEKKEEVIIEAGSPSEVMIETQAYSEYDGEKKESKGDRYIKIP